MCDTFVDNGGSGLIAFHGQSGDIMFQGATEETTQTIFNAHNGRIPPAFLNLNSHFTFLLLLTRETPPPP
jgi:hypothetical protein